MNSITGRQIVEENTKIRKTKVGDNFEGPLHKKHRKITFWSPLDPACYILPLSVAGKLLANSDTRQKP